MRLAALILAHQYPAQVAKLVTSLTNKDIAVYIHVDARAEEVFFKLKEILAHDKKAKFVEKRYKVFWGSFNQVRATLELIKAAEKQDYDYYSLLSGQDLPIKPIDSFKKFLEENKGKEFIHWYKLPHFENHGKTGGMDRMELYWLDVDPSFKYLNAKTTDIIQKAQRVFGKRKLNFELYSGSQWFTLSGKAIKYCLEHIQKDPAFFNRFKYTRCADEIFFHTLMLNSPLKEQVMNENLRYIDWHSGPEFPKVLRLEDLDKLKEASNKFFGRKFDEQIDAEVIEKLVTYA